MSYNKGDIVHYKSSVYATIAFFMIIRQDSRVTYIGINLNTKRKSPLHIEQIELATPESIVKWRKENG